MTAIFRLINGKTSQYSGYKFIREKYCAQRPRQVEKNFIELQYVTIDFKVERRIPHYIETEFTRTRPAAAITSPQILHKLILKMNKRKVSSNFLLTHKLLHIG